MNPTPLQKLKYFLLSAGMFSLAVVGLILWLIVLVPASYVIEYLDPQLEQRL